MILAEHNIKKIGIFRTLQLGDMLCAIPAVRALRHAYPQAEIILLGLPWAQTLTQRFNHLFDGFIHFPGYPGLPEQGFDAAAFHEFTGLMQQQEFDLLLQMQGNGTLVNPMMELLGAKYVAGFKTDGHYAPDNGLFLDYPDYGSEIERHLLLMGHLGIESMGKHLEFPITQEDENEFSSLNLSVEPKQYVIIHPGSRGAWRQWPTDHFAKLGEFCAEEGYKVVVTGTKDELDIVGEVIGKMKCTPLNLAGKTSMGAVGVLIRDAALLVSNCTGVSHVASALKTPSVVISMDGEPHRWGPLDGERHRTINWLKYPDFNLVFKELVELLEQVAAKDESLPQQ